MHIGARNRIEGEVVGIKQGPVMCQVRIRTPGDFELDSVMTVDSLEAMNLEIGDTVRVVVKAVNVLLVKE